MISIDKNGVSLDILSSVFQLKAKMEILNRKYTLILVLDIYSYLQEDASCQNM